MTDTLRISDPGDLVSLVPYLVGFVPTESLVVVWIDHGRIAMTARLDVDMPRPHVMTQLRGMRQRLPGASAVLVGWSSDRRLARRAVRAAAAALPAEIILDRLLCDGQRWYSLTCRDASCCPPGGTPLDADSQAVCQAVMAGLGHVGSREEAVAVVTGPPAGEHDRLTGLADEIERRHDELDEARRADLLRVLVAELAATGETPDETGRVELAVLASSDLAAVGVVTSLSMHDAAGHAALWEQVVATAPPVVAAGAVAILGIASWLSGSGAVATQCCIRLEQLDPEHPVLGLLQSATLQALPPRVWEQARGRLIA